MKTCPQCSSVFADDYVYCLNDGNILRDESGEQETIVASKIKISTGAETESTVSCPSCGGANRGSSRFCKKCGGPLAATPNAWPPQPSPGFNRPPDETIAFQSPVFTPPAPTQVQHSQSGGNKTMIVALALVAIFVIGGAIIYSKQGSGSADNTANANRPTNANRAVANASNIAPANSVSNTAPSQPSMIGRQGGLTTNVIIRSDAGNWNANLGSHYKNARVEVLDQTSFTTPEGVSTWYRVRVLQNGCDEEEGQGCGNDRDRIPGQASMEGWMNARFIQLF